MHVDPRFAQRMRALLAACGMSYRALAAHTYYGKSYLHELATGRRAPSAEVARRIDDALHAGGELVALATAGPPEETDMSINRRSVLAAMAALGVSDGVAGLVASFSDTITPSPAFADWREAAWEHGHNYMTLPRADFIRNVTADLTALRHLLGVASGNRHADMCAAGAQMAVLLAIASSDLGRAADARSAWHLARGLAEASQAPDCQALVRGQEAVMSLYVGRPLPVVLRVADDGLAAGAPMGSSGLANLLGARAQTLAWMGRVPEAEATFGEFRAAYDALPDSVTSMTGSIFGWPAYRAMHVEAFVRSGGVGSQTGAEAAEAEALAGLPPDRRISRCQVRLHRAVRLVRDGDVDGGAYYAAAALGALPQGQHGRFVQAIAETVVRSVPTPDRDRPPVRELRVLVPAA